VRTDHYLLAGAAVVVAFSLGATLTAQRGRGESPGPPPNPVHTHIGHVMTQWKDTPSTQGFLPVAVADGKVAAVHAGYMQKAPDNLDSIKLHAGHVLNALDPSLEAKGPGSGYGVKQAAAGALQHLQLAAKSEGASKNVLTHTEHVSASLEDVMQWTDAAIATAQKIRAATTAAAAAPLVTELVQQLAAINSGMDANKDGKVGWQTGEGGLEQAQMHMGFMMKGEGLQ
jgi:hypothetical protein